jgi:cytochrome c553
MALRYVLVLLALAAASALAQAPAFTPSAESPADYPAGPGREQTFVSCTPCHGFKLVAHADEGRRDGRRQ